MMYSNKESNYKDLQLSTVQMRYVAAGRHGSQSILSPMTNCSLFNSINQSGSKQEILYITIDSGAFHNSIEIVKVIETCYTPKVINQCRILRLNIKSVLHAGQILKLQDMSRICRTPENIAGQNPKMQDMSRKCGTSGNPICALFDCWEINFMHNMDNKE